MQETCRELERKIKEMELTSVCTYCHKVLISDKIENKMKDVIEHMANCEKHPVSILLDKLSEIEKWFIDHKEHSIEIHNGYAKLTNSGMFSLDNNEHYNSKLACAQKAVEAMEKYKQFFVSCSCYFAEGTEFMTKDEIYEAIQKETKQLECAMEAK